MDSWRLRLLSQDGLMKTLSSEGCLEGISSEGLTQSMEGRVLCRLIGLEKLNAGRARCPFSERSEAAEGERGIVVVGVNGDWARDKLELGDKARLRGRESYEPLSGKSSTSSELSWTDLMLGDSLGER